MLRLAFVSGRLRAGHPLQACDSGSALTSTYCTRLRLRWPVKAAGKEGEDFMTGEGEGGDRELHDAVVRLADGMRGRRWRLCTAESCTGGYLAKVMTDLAGSSEWFECGFVTYSNAAKSRQLGVSPDTLQAHGAVSEAVVNEMVAGALRAGGTEVAVAVSGVAGPGGGSEDKPVGTVWLAWGVRGRPTVARRFQFHGDRARVRHQAVVAAVAGLVRVLDGRRP